MPIEECWKETGKAPVGVRWVDTNKGDKENPEYKRRLVANEIKGGLVCSDAPTGGEEGAVFALEQYAWIVS